VCDDIVETAPFSPNLMCVSRSRQSRKRGMTLSRQTPGSFITPRQIPIWCARCSRESPSSKGPYVAKFARCARAPETGKCEAQSPRRSQAEIVALAKRYIGAEAEGRAPVAAGVSADWHPSFLNRTAAP